MRESSQMIISLWEARLRAESELMPASWGKWSFWCWFIFLLWLLLSKVWEIKLKYGCIRGAYYSLSWFLNWLFMWTCFLPFPYTPSPGMSNKKQSIREFCYWGSRCRIFKFHTCCGVSDSSPRLQSLLLYSNTYLRRLLDPSCRIASDRENTPPSEM